MIFILGAGEGGGKRHAANIRGKKPAYGAVDAFCTATGIGLR
jgi:hypothetical protein